MPIRLGGTEVTKAYLGTQEIEVAYLGDTRVLAPPAPSEPDYSVDAATASGWTGYWFNNAGSVVGGSYTFTRPDGSSSSIRQTMCQSRTAPMRFAMTGSGLAIAQFPPTIITQSGDTSVTWTRPSTSFNVGQGSAANYTTVSSNIDVAAVFNDLSLIHI